MIGIKKVEVQPLDINYGKIIDSFSTTDDKTKNAPSINAVENYVASTSFPNEKIAVINEEVTIPANEGVYTHYINFPTGFTKHNSVILSTMTNTGTPDSATVSWTPTELFTFISSNNLIHMYEFSLGDIINQQPTKITLDISRNNVPTTDVTKYFKIVLMRID